LNWPGKDFCRAFLLVAPGDRRCRLVIAEG
jgi:hypothetical protein